MAHNLDEDLIMKDPIKVQNIRENKRYLAEKENPYIINIIKHIELQEVKGR